MEGGAKREGEGLAGSWTDELNTNRAQEQGGMEWDGGQGEGNFRGGRTGVGSRS